MLSRCLASDLTKRDFLPQREQHTEQLNREAVLFVVLSNKSSSVSPSLSFTKSKTRVGSTTGADVLEV